MINIKTHFVAAGLGLSLLLNCSLAVAESDEDIFDSILPQLQKTKVPLRLPTYLAIEEETTPLYAIVEKVTSNRYTIQLAFDPDCEGGGACSFGSLTGENAKRKIPVLKGNQVNLSEDITGYFKDAKCGSSCSDSTLTWEQEGFRYTVGLKAGKKETLIKIANSAIENSADADSDE